LSFNGGGIVSTGTGVLRALSLGYDRLLPGSLTINEGALAELRGNVDLTDVPEIWIDDAAATTLELNISANITARAVVKHGEGALHLGGNNQLTSVVLNQGTLTFSSDTAFGTAPVALNGGKLSTTR